MKHQLRWLGVNATSLAILSGVAVAQPVEDEEAPPAGEPAEPSAPAEIPETTVPAPPPAPAAPPETAPPPPPAPAMAASRTVAAVPTRPVGFSMGIGFGYDLPAELDVPDITSVRFRLSNGLTFEPFLDLSTSAFETETPAGDTKDGAHTLGIGTIARIPLMMRGKVDFDLLASALVVRDTDDPDGSNNSVTQTVVNISWGLGLDYWLNQHWALSFSATNPFASVVQVNQELDGPDVTTTTSAIGVIFDPDVFLTVHLFY